jgi:hypothetical protein
MKVLSSIEFCIFLGFFVVSILFIFFGKSCSVLTRMRGGFGGATGSFGGATGSYGGATGSFGGATGSYGELRGSYGELRGASGSYGETVEITRNLIENCSEPPRALHDAHGDQI